MHTLILFLLICSVVPQSFISVTNTQISQISNYSFGVFNSIVIPAGATVALYFPTDYPSFTLHQNQPYTIYDVNNDQCPITCIGVTATYSAYTFFFQNMFPSSASLNIYLTIFSITNPSIPITSSNFILSVFKGSVVYYTSSIEGITFNAKTIQCAFALQYTQLWALSPLTLTFTPNPSTYSMQVVFPITWLDQKIQKRALSSTPYCTSTAMPLVYCSLPASTLFVTQTATKSSTVDLVINQIFNPTSLIDAGPIVLTTFDYSNRPLDICSLTIPKLSFSKTLLRRTSTVVSYTAFDTLSITVSFTIAISTLPFDRVYITFPPQIPLSPATTYIVSVSNIVVNVAVNPQPLNTISFDILDSIIQASIVFTANGISRPHAALQSSSFTISTLRNNKYQMDSIVCCKLVLAPRNTLIGQPIIMSSSMKQATGVSYTFIFTTSINLLATDSISIQFPSQYALTCNIVLSSIIPINIPLCTIVQSTLILSAFIRTTQQHTFTLAVNSLTNPSSSPSSLFTIATITSLSYVIEEYTPPQITITSTLITFTVSPSSLLTAQPNVTYTFNIANISPLYVNYVLTLQYPLDSSLNTTLLKCIVNTFTFPCQNNQNSISILIQSTINTLSNVQINGFTNPISFLPTAPFALTISDANSIINEQSNNAPTLTMKFINNVSSFQISPSNCILYSLCSVTVFIIIPHLASGTTTIILTFTDATIINPFCSIQCTALSTTVLSLTYPLLSSTLLVFTIGNVTMLSNSTVSLLMTNNIDLMYPFISLTPIASAQLSNYTIAFTNTVLGASSSATLTINAVSAPLLTRLSSITIFTPPQFSIAQRTLTLTSPLIINNTLSYTFSTINPTTQTYTPFAFLLYDSNNNVIGYSNGTVSFTRQCILPCATCNGILCLTCYSSLPWVKESLFYNNNCVRVCPAATYNNLQNTCLPCDINCSLCAYTDGSICTACAPLHYLFNNRCYLTCPITHYADNYTCSLCPSSCASCTNVSCSTCISTLSLYNGTCYTACPTSTYSLTTPNTTSSVCTPCATNCISCNALGCLSCANHLYLVNAVCLDSCPPPLLPTLYQDCALCQCLTCSLSAYNCTACSPILLLYNNACVQTCPNSTYTNVGQCVGCETNCLACQSAGCTHCGYGYALYNSTCVHPCPPATVMVLQSGAYQCKQCIAPCLTCANTPTLCHSCTTNYSLYNHLCFTQCPIGLFPYSGVCLPCEVTCRHCITTVCLSCVAGYNLHQNICLLDCPPTSYTQYTTHQCKPCNASCLTCQDSSNCSSCNGTFLLHSLCITNCPSPYYPYSNECLLCSNECKTCSSGPFFCSACNLYFYLTAVIGTCTPNCTAPYYYVTNATNMSLQCISCQPPCAECNTRFDFCTSCIDKYFLFSNSCLEKCPNNYYVQGSKCLSCAYPCATCMTQTKCITCIAYAYAYRETCVLNCSVYADAPYVGGQYCTNCLTIPFCAGCTGAKCQSCANPYVEFQGQCLLYCPNNYAASEQRVCIITPAYIQTLQQLYQYNTPIVPPFAFLILWLLIIAIIALKNKLCRTDGQDNSNKHNRRDPKYNWYHLGYTIASLAVIDLIVLAYGGYYILTRYTGDYLQRGAMVPLYLLMASGVYKVVCSVVYIKWVLWEVYLKDIRYAQWRATQRYCGIVSMVGVVGCRWHKLYFYLGAVILSVSKFKREDQVNILLCVGDVIDAAAYILIASNLQFAYSVLYLLPFEIVLIKIIMWVLLAMDLKKREKGFFNNEDQEVMSEDSVKNHFKDTADLVKMIRVKSQLVLPHLEFDKKDTISVYNPQDYEDGPRVAKKRIEKAIEAGRFRRGDRITLDKKLQKFANSLSSKKPQTESFLNNLLYWRVPKNVEIIPKPPTEESMLRVLEDKESQYREDFSILQPYQQIPDQTGERFYQQYHDFMNLNYARKKHLQPVKSEVSLNQHGLRILHHQPKRKRNN